MEKRWRLWICILSGGPDWLWCWNLLNTSCTRFHPSEVTIAQIMPLALTLMSGSFADISSHGGLLEYFSSSKTRASR